ncbi:MAG: hypothetical protein FJX54_11260 [Alphaproteobacteria bacterium]|nr:hypothetical protein [Alphaproteobacteria bacterium]
MPADIAAAPPRPTLLDYAYRGQPLLAATGMLMLLTLIPTMLAFALDGRVLNGVSVWIKPLKFEVSLAIHLLTVAWLMLCLPEEIRARRTARGFAIALAAASIFEIAYIAFQASRGEASHFNVATPIAGLMYTLMGVGALTLVIASVGVGIQILRHGDRRNPIVFAAGLGIVLGNLLGGLTGMYMSNQTGHWVGGLQTDAGGVPIFGWSRSGGDLRVAHFFGLHLMQALPIAAWLARDAVAERLQRPLVIGLAILGTLVTAGTWLQAVHGLPLL